MGDDFVENWFATGMGWFPEWMAIPYTEVRAYAFNREGRSAAQARFLEQDGSLNASILNPGGILLDSQCVQQLEQLILEQPRDRMAYAVCVPVYRHAFAFFAHGKRVKHIELCFDCQKNWFDSESGGEKPFDFEQWQRFSQLLHTLGVLELTD